MSDREPSRALEGKVVVVTGSTRGIGRAIAEACADAGATVVVSSRSEDAVAETVGALAARGARCSGMVADVSCAEDIEALLEHALGVWWGLDAWVNNAGISLGYRPLDECSAEELDAIVSVNLTGTLLAARQVLPYFHEHGGTLVNMAGRGYRGDATPHTAAYAATKAAVASVTRSLAAENARYPVSVHAIVPGMVETDFYRDIRVSPRLESTKDDWRHALDAFGVPLEEVGRRTVPILAQEPGKETGRVYSFLGGARTARGIAKISWARLSGKMGRG